MDSDNYNKSATSFQEYAMSTLSEMLVNGTDYFATFSAGQYVLKKIDKILWVIEKTALWSVPYKKIVTMQENGGGNEVTPPILIRPLPWILFFPVLITLCLFRKTINIFTILTGMETRISAEIIVKYVQNKRKYLRKVRFSGYATIRARYEKNEHPSMIQKLYNMVMGAVCMPGISCEETLNKSGNAKEKRIANGLNLNTTESDDGDDTETMEGFLDKITKLSEIPSDEDSDYLPSLEETSEDDDSESTEEEELAKSSPPKGKYELNQLSRSTSVKGDIISEENEDSDVSNTQDTNKKLADTKIPNGDVRKDKSDAKGNEKPTVTDGVEENGKNKVTDQNHITEQPKVVDGDAEVTKTNPSNEPDLKTDEKKVNGDENQIKENGTAEDLPSEKKINKQESQDALNQSQNDVSISEDSFNSTDSKIQTMEKQKHGANKVQENGINKNEHFIKNEQEHQKSNGESHQIN